MKDDLEQRVQRHTSELTAVDEQLRHEIEERRHAEEALAASEERFRFIFEEAPVGMVICVGDGVITKANRAVCRMSGYCEKELVGRHVRDFTHPDDRDTSAPLVKRLLACEIPGFTLEKRYLRKSGEAFWTQATTAAIHGPDGAIVFALGIIEDISERKRAQEALCQSHDQLRAIYDGMVEGLMITDIETKRIMRVNPSLCRMLGYTEEELLARSIRDIHPPEDVPNDLGRFQAAAEGRVSMNEERPMLRKDGTVFYADISGRSISYERRPCLLALMRDVTQRKRAQEALRRERRSLEHMLQASDHERQLIAYDIHDGLAQELAGAIMQFQVYDQFKNTRPADAQKAYDSGLTLLRQGHAEARRLISGVRPPILDESGVVVAIAHLVHDPALEQGPEINFHSRVTFQRLAPVVENVIYRIVQEGLTNARRHSKSKAIRIRLVQEGENLRIEIRDWGVGFDPKAVQDNRFGLEGIRERARLLGGKCRIRSRPGKGTALVVVLPVTERHEE